MNSKKLTIMVILALTLVAFVVVLADQNKPPEQSPKPVGLLDGKVFDGTVKTLNVPPDKIVKPMVETITFTDGMFFSLAFKSLGFGETAYVSKRDGSNVIFTVSCVKADEPMVILEWNGVVKSSKTSNLSILTASVKLSREGKVLNEYSVSAKLRLVDTPTPE